MYGVLLLEALNTIGKEVAALTTQQSDHYIVYIGSTVF